MVIPTLLQRVGPRAYVPKVYFKAKEQRTLSVDNDVRGLSLAAYAKAKADLLRAIGAAEQQRRVAAEMAAIESKQTATLPREEG